ncbi:DUF2514 family protein [uncultured Pseudomonas sp.]|uniref:DUF2514 family protein n=1 Tax=uncultured Pseudomonas sp. TaxID=114707 RepID=UPI00261FF7ED|nr:DUF2514 family protein [uncultured Pseudomonas sp.]
MTWLRLVPAWAYWLLALLIVAGVQQVRVSGAQVKASGAVSELASYRAEVSERDRLATLAALQETKRRMTVSEEVQKDAEQQIETALADAARAGTALERLQQRLDLAERRSRAAGNTITAQLSQAAEAEARVRTELLGRLGALAQLYAAEADDRGIRGRACERQYESLSGG